MAYKIIIPPDVQQDIAEYLEYLRYIVGGSSNPVAAEKFVRNLDLAIANISTFPYGYALCEDSELHDLSLRKIHFANLNYKLFFHIKGQTVYLDAIRHDAQDRLKPSSR